MEIERFFPFTMLVLHLGSKPFRPDGGEFTKMHPLMKLLFVAWTLLTGLGPALVVDCIFFLPLGVIWMIFWREEIEKPTSSS